MRGRPKNGEIGNRPVRRPLAKAQMGGDCFSLSRVGLHYFDLTSHWIHPEYLSLLFIHEAESFALNIKESQKDQ